MVIISILLTILWSRDMKKILEYKNLIMAIIVLILFAACFMPTNEKTEEVRNTTEYSETLETNK